MKWILLPALLLAGCGAPSYSYSCGNPQVPLGAYAVAQVSEPVGTLLVKVVTPSGEPVPGARFSLAMEFTGPGPRPRCGGSGLTDKTGADGALRLDRLKPGLYALQVLDDTSEESVQVTVHPNQTAEVTLSKR
ncbi:hypothetical protein D3C72_2021230 [compost metagenome]